MRNQERRKAHLGQKNTRQPISLQNRAKHQHDKGPGPPKNPPANQGAGAPPLPPLRPTLQEVVQLMPPRTVAWVLTKNTSLNYHIQAIKEGPLFTFTRIHLEKKSKSTYTFLLASS